MRSLLAGAGLAALALGCQSSSSARLTPLLATEPVAHDPDDPAIWIHPDTPEKSLLLGTDKIEGGGGLYVFGLDGQVRQVIAPLDRPNNVDVEYGLQTAEGPVDVAVLTERRQHRLRVFAIPPDGGALRDLAPEGLPVLAGEGGEAGEPMGIALYKRPRDGALFAVVAPKTGAATDYLWQYRIAEVDGALRATLVRRFGAFSRRGASPGESGEIEAVAVDDTPGYVYYADERYGIRKWHADPDHADAERELAVFGTDGYLGDREGLAIFDAANGRGFLVSSDQVDGGTRLLIYPREGTPGNAHDHPLLATIPTPADATDGLEVTSRPLPGFPAGLLMMMNSTPRNFLLFSWTDVQAWLPGPGQRTGKRAAR